MRAQSRLAFHLALDVNIGVDIHPHPFPLPIRRAGMMLEDDRWEPLPSRR
jgi:hypothetical protein